MVGETFVAEPVARGRSPLAFGVISIVGGGCYGSYYVRQLLRAERAGAVTWSELRVVDRDADCMVGGLAAGDRPTALRLVTAEWEAYFEEYLSAGADRGDTSSRDAIVPSPLMPHLLAHWLVRRARDRWPKRSVAVVPLEALADAPWHQPGSDGTLYVSFAQWMCPINCVEPAKCPHTRGTRDWSMPVTIARHASVPSAGRPREPAYVFRCLHRTHGVGMIDVAEVLAADAALGHAAAEGAFGFLVGTASHCHGAVQRIAVSGPAGN